MSVPLMHALVRWADKLQEAGKEEYSVILKPDDKERLAVLLYQAVQRIKELQDESERGKRTTANS